MHKGVQLHSASEQTLKSKCTNVYIHSASGLNASFLRTVAGAQKQLELAAAAAAAEATAANEPGPRALQCNPVQTTKS